jgi:hypothetical protein
LRLHQKESKCYNEVDEEISEEEPLDD